LIRFYFASEDATRKLGPIAGWEGEALAEPVLIYRDYSTVRRIFASWDIAGNAEAAAPSMNKARAIRRTES
jgi:hypothetical protein